MILSDKDISEFVRNTDDNFRLVIDPWNDQNLQPSGYDVCLGDEVLAWKSNVISVGMDISSKMEKYKGEYGGFLNLPPGFFCLGTTVERVELPPTLCAQVHGRSSIGRLGVAVHITAGYIDPGFKGQITLEIVNHSQNWIQIPRGERIAQLVFMRMCCVPTRLYHGRYQNQEGPTASKLWIPGEK